MGRLNGLGLRGASCWAITLGSLAAALAASACSATPDSKGSAGAAGSVAITAGNGGASGSPAGTAGSGGDHAAGGAGTAGTTGSGGASLFGGDTTVDACLFYLQAACQRRSECQQTDPVACFLGSSAGCPDAYFSEGSTRTVAGSKACAETYKTFPCAQILAGDLPSCVTAGTRAAGQTCSYPSQCSSLNCTVPGGSKCGVCAIAGPAGADCSVAGVVCNDGLRCNAANVCEVIPPSTKFSAKEGQPCTIADGCADLSLYCPSSSTTPVCTKYPTLGMSCADSGTCFGDSYCQDGKTCVALPAVGAPCGGATATSSTGFCAKNAICSATGTCVAKGSIGSPCAGSNDQCSSELSCTCVDTTCTSSVCSLLRYSGQSCGTLGMSCQASFTCTNGVCQPITSRGVFAACGN